MKFEVKQVFRCRLSKKIYKKNSVYETDDKARAEELQKRGFLGAEVKEKNEKKADKK